MNIEEIDKWLDNEYGMSYTKLEELHDYFFEKYTDQKEEIERLNNIIKEVRESANRELKIAEENIKQSEKWLDIEEEQGHAKRDIHTGKVVKRYMKMFLDILDKGE